MLLKGYVVRSVLAHLYFKLVNRLLHVVDVFAKNRVLLLGFRVLLAQQAKFRFASCKF